MALFCRSFSMPWMHSCIPASNNAATSHCQLQSNLKKIPLPRYTASASLILLPYKFGGGPSVGQYIDVNIDISIFLKYRRHRCILKETSMFFRYYLAIISNSSVKILQKFLYKLLRFSYKTSSNFHQNFPSLQNFSYSNFKILENSVIVFQKFPRIVPNFPNIFLFFLEVWNCFKYALQFRIIQTLNEGFLKFLKFFFKSTPKLF